jgi:MinD-like ATPase involved in chromosome partitioning or flagellar assembly
MALANIAECFYLQGLRVLMVDWDLEAPGLETFFFESDTSNASDASDVDAVQSRLGLLDLLTEYKRAFPDLVKAADPSVDGADASAPAAEDTFRGALSSALSLRSFLFPIHGSIKGREPHLSLLPAGWRGRERFASYAEAVQAFDWQEFYSAYRGFDYFEWMKAEMARFADVVFIDSRTGVTEMGGVCARQLADVVVSFCAPNFQNVDGVARMVDSFRNRPDLERMRNRRPLQTLVIPTRIEPKDLDRLRKFLKRFEERVDQAGERPPSIRDRSFWDLRIPFVSAYAYEEKRVIGPEGTVEQLDPTKSLENAYWKLATTLARLAPPDLRVQSRFADRIATEFGTPVPQTVISFERDAEAAGRRVHALLESAGVLLWPDLDHRSPSPLQSLESSKSLFVVLSPAATTSTIVRDDIRRARERGAAVSLVRAADVAPVAAQTDGVSTRCRSGWRVTRCTTLTPIRRSSFSSRSIRSRRRRRR